MPARHICPTVFALWLVLGAFGAQPAGAGDAPSWMRAQLNGALPAHDEKTAAVVLYAETTLTVQPNGKIKKLYRELVRILRPDGETRGTIREYFHAHSPLTDLPPLCIPVSSNTSHVKQNA